MNGWRIDMEDKVLVEYDASADFGVFGVFDGHGDGGHASDYVAKNLLGKLTSRPGWASAYRAHDPDLLASSIVSACYDLDEGLRGDASRPTRDGGTTAIIALVCDRHLIVANVGDSRCILTATTTTSRTPSCRHPDRRWCARPTSPRGNDRTTRTCT